MKALVTGAKGMLGQDLCPILEDNGYEVIETDRDNLDITQSKLVDSFIKDTAPDLIVHCAAYTNADKAELDLDNARLLNAVGSTNVAKAAAKYNSTLVYISTDYVFDGKKKTMYLVDDEPHPLNNYGITKLEGEKAVQKYCTKYYIARTSWLYGHHGKNFVETMISLKDKEVLNVVNDQIGCPTWTVDLCDAILKILEMPYGIYHLCGSGETSWYGLAKETFRLMNLNVNLVACTSDEYIREAKRPSYSAMNNGNLCRDWKIALKEYINLRVD